jgi:X-X-X-Leu-X-X-Gly heptad repeat protein
VATSITDHGTTAPSAHNGAATAQNGAATVQNGAATASSFARFFPGRRAKTKQTFGILIRNPPRYNNVWEFFAKEDQPKIPKVVRRNARDKVAVFKTEADRDAALARLPDEMKGRGYDYAGRGDQTRMIIRKIDLIQSFAGNSTRIRE